MKKKKNKRETETERQRDRARAWKPRWIVLIPHSTQS